MTSNEIESGGFMDFTNRGAGQSQPTRPSNQAINNSANSSASNNGGARPLKKLSNAAKDSASEPGWLRIIFVVLLFSLTILAISVSALFYFGNPSETKYLSSKRVQAVFLDNGQVYFGTIKELTPRHINLQSIYYLNTQNAQPAQENSTTKKETTNFSLVKLGCEIHGPYDQMIINREQVLFWENLRDDGQVAKAIAQWKQQNPNGQTCSAANNSNSSNNTNSTTNTTTNSNNTPTKTTGQ